MRKPGVEAAIHEHKLVVEFEVTLAVSCAELELVSGPDARRAGETVEIAMVLAPLGNLEVGKGLGLRHENNIEVAKVGVEIGFAFDGAVQGAVFFDLKNAAEFGWKDALDHEAAGLERLLHVHGVSIDGVVGSNQSGRRGTRRRLSDKVTAENSQEDETGQEINGKDPGHIHLRESPIAAV
jgi:hypothetical protein